MQVPAESHHKRQLDLLLEEPGSTRVSMPVVYQINLPSQQTAMAFTPGLNKEDHLPEARIYASCWD